ncbi:IclR family transcriptional regulator [Caballeronia telluris]|uniref:IclR family transcriptional regulator n=2 Tax=Caballeronia telluris TaxID=326475 RepID=A0A158KIC0_9BURK|nr:IclR family transcriptional regulator [Caballeronia telluris]
MSFETGLPLSADSPEASANQDAMPDTAPRSENRTPRADETAAKTEHFVPETPRHKRFEYNEADPFSGTADMKKADTPTLRAFALLEHLVAADGPVSLADIAHEVDAPKASLHRMLASLEAGGLVIREPGQKNAYVIGPRLAQLGLGVMMHSGARRLRHAILSRLVSDLGETCNLTMLHETEVLYLDRMEAPWPLRLDLKPGSHVPAYCSASGKLLLAMLPTQQRSILVRALQLERFTPNTITDPELLEAELDRVAHKGIAVDNEEFVVGIVCVAAPVIDEQNQCVAAIAVHAPVSRAPLSRALEFVPRLQDAAKELAKTF